MSHSAIGFFRKDSFRNESTLMILEANNLSEDDKNLYFFYCPCCGCRVYLVISTTGNNYFASGRKQQHRPNCIYANKRVKQKKIPAGDPVPNLHKVLSYQDKPKSSNHNNRDNPHSQNIIIEDTTLVTTDPIYEFDVNSHIQITSLKHIIQIISQKNMNDFIPIVMGKNSTRIQQVLIKNIFINQATFLENLTKDLSGKKIMVAQKTYPKNFGLPTKYNEAYVQVPYYSNNAQSTIFLQIHCSEESINKHFLDDLFESDLHKNDYIILLANWKKIDIPEHPDYKVYAGTLNSKSYFWITKKKFDELFPYL